MEKQQNNKVMRSRVLRILFLALGFISFGLGTTGIFLPILPTVPFYLLTAFCFVRGSKKFADWFLNSKLYKNHVGNFARHRMMTLYGELILLLSVSAMLLATLYFLNKPVVSIIFTVLIAFKYVYFVFRVTPVTRKEYIKVKNEDQLLSETEEALAKERE